jgi:hypothetical protein
MIHPAVKFQFGRIVQEYGSWHAIDEYVRSRAPGWWWGPALALRDAHEQMPTDWLRLMALPDAGTYSDAARLLLDSLAGQTSQPWPNEFPRQYQTRPTATDAA